jgi:glycosyltransferase involved in cell wall biosynthesis
VKGKIVEALHYGIPVVTTDIGAEGMPDVDPCLRIATASDMASAIVALYSDISTLRRYAKQGPEYVQHHFSYEAIMEVFRQEISI